MKKILASLATIAIIGSSVTSVVSCGPITFAKLMERTVRTDVYRGTYKAPITNWASAVTMQLDDSVILTNAQDTLLATDQYNQFEGDLADKWMSSADAKTWSFHVRDNEHAGHWTSVSGKGNQKDEGMIKPSDFFNTFRFVFNPNNMSQTVGIWQTVVKNGDKLNQFISDLRDPKSDLYDEHFVKAGKYGEVRSNEYIDRAILVFNKLKSIDEDTLKTAKKDALDQNILWDDLIKDSFENGQIISGKDAIGQDYNLIFNLEKPVPYFDSMAAFLAYAPMPDISVDYLYASTAGSKYGRVSGKKFGYQTIYYSGAYVVKDYNPTLRIKMVQNKFYFNRKSLKVRELNYAYIGNVDVSRQRFYFETGDISEVNIQPTDLAGWKKYVGSDLDNLNFEGANLTSRPQAGTFAMIYNYNSTRSDNKNETDASNVALSQRSVRGFIRYVFDRSRVASYYSKAMDKTSTSMTLRNSWTSKNLAFDPEGKDYATYLAKDYFDSEKPTDNKTIGGWLNQALTAYGLTNDNYNTWSETYGTQKDDESKTKSALDDGYDPFMRNDLLGALIFVDDKHGANSDVVTPKNEDRLKEYTSLIGNYTNDAANQKLTLIKQQVKDDLQKYNVPKATLTWLANGALSTTMNNNVKDAVRTFNQNAGSDSPIDFKVVESTDMNDYRVQSESGKFSVISNGWVPDYADPYTFLHSIVAGGDLEAYYGYGRLFNQKTDADGNVTLEVKDGISNPEAYDDLKDRVEIFTNQVTEIDKTEADPVSRYTKFAGIENFAMIESMLVQPLLFQQLDTPAMISFVNPFTRSTYTSGQALFRFVGVEMVPQLWNHDIFAEKKKEWEDNRGSYISIYPDENGEFIPDFDGHWNK